MPIARAAKQQHEQQDRVDSDSHRAGQRQAEILRAAHKEPIERKTREGHHRADHRGRDGVARGVKSARQNVLRAPAKHSERKQNQRGRGGVQIRFVQPRVRKHQMHQRPALRHGQRGDGHEHQHQPFHRAVQHAVHLVQAAFGVKSRQHGQRRDADGLPHDSERHAHQRLAVSQPSDRGRLQIRSEPADHPIVSEGKRKRQHDRHGELHEHDEARMPEVERRRKFRADAHGAVDL